VTLRYVSTVQIFLTALYASTTHAVEMCPTDHHSAVLYRNSRTHHQAVSVD